MTARTGAFLLGMALLPGSLAAQETDENRAADWCDIDAPGEVVPGQPVEVKVTLKKPEKAARLGVDLHWMREDGNYGGFLAYGGRRDVSLAGEQVFRFEPEIKAGMATLVATAFLSPDDDFDHHTHVAHKGGIQVKQTAEMLAKLRRPDSVTFKKSSIEIRVPDGVVKEGDEFEITVAYHLHPDDFWGDEARLKLVPLGPWVDNPDGKYTKERHHVSYPGIDPRSAAVKPGRGELKFRYKLEQAYRYNDIGWMALFEGADGQDWPWHVRESGPEFRQNPKFYEIETGKPGGLFVGEEPVRITLTFKEGVTPGEKQLLNYTLVDVYGSETKGSLPLTAAAPGKSEAFEVKPPKRGTYLLETEVEGWGKRSLFFARIPDVLKATGGAATPFGGTNLTTDRTSRAASLLGLSYNRLFFEWIKVQPEKEIWKWNAPDKILETNRKHGLLPWLCIINPPPWVMPEGVHSVTGYEPFPFDAESWRASAAAMTGRWKDQIWGWEWLNEIVPGDKSPDPVADYLRFCRIGTGEVRRSAPHLKIQMAGGLWPRNFRNDLLRAGLGEYIDVLPIHYSNLGGVMEARSDLNAAGFSRVAVWDNETANGLSVWNMPEREQLKITSQSRWVLDRWPDELTGGAQAIIYFGGWPNAAGNWTYLLDESTPRPVAATLAVLSSKIALAKPLGKFFLPGGGVFHLFEKDGKPVLVAASSSGQEGRVVLDTGAPKITATDYQGNETILDAPGGKLSVELDPLGIFLEGGNLDVLKTQAAVSVGESNLPTAHPHLVLVRGTANAQIPVKIRNLYNRPLEGEISLEAPPGWPSPAPAPFSIPPGKEESFALPLSPGRDAESGDFDLKARVRFSDASLPAVEKLFGVTFANPDVLGNLIKNGGFEEPGQGEKQAGSWNMGPSAQRHPSGGEIGLGEYGARLQNVQGEWVSMAQTIPVPAGQRLLYSAWIRNEDMQAGSNVTFHFPDGKTDTLYIPEVFDAGMRSPGWRLLSAVIDIPPDVRSASFVPVARGTGWSLYDNIRVTLYNGTRYAAEAYRAKQPVRVDGKLDEWNQSCPIPLLGDNQLAVFNPSYQWTPENLGGAAWLQWDETNLYVAFQVRDDQVSVPSTGEETVNSDSVMIAIHPANRMEGNNGQAFAYYLSMASPGGGSGKHTLYRPPSKSGGLPSGQLAKDSSVYDVAIVREGNVTTYEARIPWQELGGIRPGQGAKFGLSLQINDNDGKGREAAMTWGDGLHPSWSPAHFGMATLVDE